MSVIAIDIGTSSIKAGLFSREGGLYSSLSVPSPSASAASMSSGQCDAEGWVAACELLLQRISGFAFESLKGDPISCLCVCGNGPSLVAVGPDGKPARPALLWIDRRAEEEARELSAILGVEIDPAFYLPKALWMLRDETRDPREIRYFMPCPEFVAFRFCGRAHAVLPSPLFENFIWSKPLLSKLRLPEDKFPPLVGPGEIVGSVTREASQRTGLPSGCAIASGLPDFMAAQLGSGVLEAGLALDRTGSSEALNLCTAKPFPDKRLLSLPHAVSGLWNVSGGVSTSGSAVAWLESLLRSRESEPAGRAFDKEIEAAGPGSGGLLFLPYLHGERAPLWNPSILGAMVGLDLSHGRGHVARALLESVCYALREVIEMQEEAGLDCTAIHASGGTLSNSFWLRLKADILKRPVVVPGIPEAELAGAAALALSASACFGSPSEAARSIFSVRRTVDPDPAPSSVYDECYHRFLEARKGIESLPLPSLPETRS